MIHDYLEYPSKSQWIEIVSETRISELYLEVSETKEGDIISSLFNQEFKSWLRLFNNRLGQSRMSYVFLMHYYKKGIPDDEWFLSPGKEGQSVQYFPHFNEENFYYNMEAIMFFLKFTQEKFVSDILAGRLYMKSVKYFREIEKINGDTVRGDKKEALIVFPKGTKLLIGDDKTEVTGIQEISFKFSFTDNIPIYCMTYVNHNNLVKYDENNDCIIYKIEESFLNSLFDSFGDTSVLIQSKPFVNRIKSYFDNNGYKFRASLVTYIDMETQFDEYHDTYFEQQFRMFFYKDKKYSYQQEYRIVVIDNVPEYKIYEIGDISDISKVCKKEDLLDLQIIVRKQ